ncbi:MAG: mannose-1-phosphate guanylyltransferase/mannose-6-phosphate isomerase [Aestuariivirga sp.]|nr:mannose-1-phosphate guanylyltransferase/mannose-6-phosphate isomerase [Aestuariivirga sp.]
MIVPVLLCGGSGTRLWPLSRQAFPKQFVALLGEETLFQAAALRLSGPGFAPALVVSGEPLRFIAARQLREIGHAAQAILVEPEPRNTAPAVLAAALYLIEQGGDAMMLVAPSDHAIPETPRFRAAVMAALPAAEAGTIVTFGIRPDRPETGYGYLRLAPGGDASASAPQPLASFVEKPDATAAAAMLASGDCLWNAGIFLFRASAIVAAFAAHAPAMLAPARAAVKEARRDSGFVTLAAGPWSALPSISLDYAIMEQAANLVVMPYDGRWSDLGSWTAVWQESEADERGNVLSGPALAMDCERSLLRSEADSVQLVAIGVSDIVAVAMPDAVLVAHSSAAQRVKEVAQALGQRGARQAAAFPHDRRPWGWFESLSNGPRYHVKRIGVDPGGALSLQSHKHRAEHWIVVQGVAKVTVGEKVDVLTENQSVYIPLGAVHRLENPGTEPLVIIEVQTGSYFGGDDIVRYEDVYGRG